MRRRVFKLRILFRSLYLSLLLRRRVRVEWRVADLVIEKDGYCPCRFGRREENRCPCRWHIEELKKMGRCRCWLFWVEGVEEGGGGRQRVKRRLKEVRGSRARGASSRRSWHR